MSLLIVGLTGGIGSGKSAVAALFQKRGIAVIDNDAMAHELTGPGGAAIEALRAEFGPEYIEADGRLDRVRMRTLVFGDPGAKLRLERILHPRIRAESDAQARAAASPYAILMIPLLVESGIDRSRYGRVLVVDCPEQAQLERVARRSGISREEVRRIMDTQATRKERIEAADDVIDNSGEFSDLEPQVARLHQRYLALARAMRPEGG